jgi:MYXO-CTERM domain-containing protein
VAVADAGGTAVATVPAPVEEAGNPMWIWVGAGAGGLLVLLILLARRRSRPPTLDD